MNIISETVLEYQKARRVHWDGITDKIRELSPAAYYHSRSTKIYQFLNTQGQTETDQKDFEGLMPWMDSLAMSAKIALVRVK